MLNPVIYSVNYDINNPQKLNPDLTKCDEKNDVVNAYI